MHAVSSLPYAEVYAELCSSDFCVISLSAWIRLRSLSFFILLSKALNRQAKQNREGGERPGPSRSKIRYTPALRRTTKAKPRK